MAVTQYIGARYVPLFADPIDWDSTKTYEPLTVVYNKGNSYTSRQYVPAGIDISNDTYWALTGNYNAQIEQYRREVQAFDGRITANAQAIADEVTARMAEDTAIRGIIADEVTARTDADKQIRTDFTAADTALGARIDALSARGRNFILIGDSFGGGIDGDNNTQAVAGGGWVDRFKAMVSGYANVYTNQVPLSGVFGFASSRPFIDVLQNAESAIEDKNTITDIVVLGGTNDIGRESNIESAISTFAAYCHANYKNARVAIGAIGSDTYNIVNSVAPYYATCIKYGCEFIGDTEALYCLPQYIGTDGTHLTAAGYEYYSQFTNQAILTGHCYFHFGHAITFTGLNDFGAPAKCNISITNTSLHYDFRNADYTPAAFTRTTYTDYSGTTVPIATINNNIRTPAKYTPVASGIITTSCTEYPALAAIKQTTIVFVNDSDQMCILPSHLYAGVTSQNMTIELQPTTIHYRIV